MQIPSKNKIKDIKEYCLTSGGTNVPTGLTLVLKDRTITVGTKSAVAFNTLSKKQEITNSNVEGLLYDSPTKLSNRLYGDVLPVTMDLEDLYEQAVRCQTDELEINLDGGYKLHLRNTELLKDLIVYSNSEIPNVKLVLHKCKANLKYHVVHLHFVGENQTVLYYDNFLIPNK